MIGTTSWTLWPTRVPIVAGNNAIAGAAGAAPAID
jgi:hypothetical protein